MFLVINVCKAICPRKKKITVKFASEEMKELNITVPKIVTYFC